MTKRNFSEDVIRRKRRERRKRESEFLDDADFLIRAGERPMRIFERMGLSHDAFWARIWKIKRESVWRSHIALAISIEKRMRAMSEEEREISRALNPQSRRGYAR